MSSTLYTTVHALEVPHKLIHRTVASVLRQVKVADAQVSVHYIGDKKMRSLNRRYRGANRTTDVLAFASLDGVQIRKSGAAADWGDIFICVPQIRRQAKRFGVSYVEESCRMLIHGVLHLAGFDHRKKAAARQMFALQETILAGILAR